MVNWSTLAPIVCISNMDDAMHFQLLEQVIVGMARNAWDVATVLIAKQVIDEDVNSELTLNLGQVSAIV